MFYRELNRNELKQIQALSLKDLKNLEEVRLKRNKIKSLDDGAFWPLKNLKNLQLDYNILTVVKKGGLFGLEHLQKFTLSHNKIANIETQAWELCKKIVELLVFSNFFISTAHNILFYFLKIIIISPGICPTMN